MMKKKMLVVLVSILFSSTVYIVYANQIEEEFKKICESIAKYWSETVYPDGEEYAAEQENILARETKLIKGWQKELRNLVKLAPDSIWADDAQYIISLWCSGDHQQHVADLEFLLEEYPDIHFEEWTRRKLSFYMPEVPVALAIRVDLCFAYQYSGDVEKLKTLCKDSIAKFPEKAPIFESFLKETSSPTPK